MSKTYEQIDSNNYRVIENDVKVTNISLSHLEDQKKILQGKIDQIDEEIKKIKDIK